MALVVDCPSEDYLPALCGDPVLRQLQETGAGKLLANCWAGFVTSDPQLISTARPLRPDRR